MKKIILLVVCNLIMTGIYSQGITHKVTDTDGRLLDSIITMAVQEANSGTEVEILFEAPGLVNISTLLSPLGHQRGYITLRKSPGATTEQGLRFSAVGSDPTVMYGLYIPGWEETKVEIRDLTFRDFSGELQRSAIRIAWQGNIKIVNCIFKNSSGAVWMDDFVGVIDISNNIFKYQSIKLSTTWYLPVIWYFGTNTPVEIDSSNISIYHNVIKSDSNVNHGSNNPDGIRIYLTRKFLLFGKLRKILEINIDSNTINDMGTGVSVATLLGPDKDGNQADPQTMIQIKGCDISDNNVGMYISHPFPYWTVENNYFNNKKEDCELWLSYPNNSINFIENGNVFGESTKNTGNDFTKTKSETSFYVWGDGAKIVGLTLNSHVCISDGSNAIVRDTRIRSNINIQKPIDRIGCDYKDFVTDIPTPIFNSASISGNSLKVEFTLKGLDPATGDFVLDFYHSNQRGDLTDYLGNLTVKDNGYFNQGFTIPAGIGLTEGDMLAVTVTSLGNIGVAAMMGTSETAYLGVTSLICNPKVTFNLNVIISDTSQPAKFYFLLGTLPDFSDIMEDQEGEIVLNNGKYFLSSNGRLFPIYNNRIETSFVLNETQYDLLQYVTVFSEDIVGIKSRIGAYKIK